VDADISNFPHRNLRFGSITEVVASETFVSELERTNFGVWRISVESDERKSAVHFVTSRVEDRIFRIIGDFVLVVSGGNTSGSNWETDHGVFWKSIESSPQVIKLLSSVVLWRKKS